MRVLLDTNVLTRVVQRGSAGHDLAVEATEKLRAQASTLCIVPQNLYEFWVVGTRPQPQNGLGYAPARAVLELEKLKQLFLLLPETPEFLPEWEKLVALHQCKGKPAHDARLVAAMLVHGVTQLLTFDAAGFGRYPLITVLTPPQVIQSPAP